ncbi:MAG TPA: S8 family serine peptidase [Solirubrobacteraceae bacterium]
MRFVAFSLALSALVVMAPGADAATTTGRLLVSLRPEARGTAHAAAAHAVIARAGARTSGSAVPQIGLVVARPGPGESLRALARRLRADPHVRAVDAERRATLRLVPNDPALSVPETAPGTPPNTPVEWWPAREDFPRAWDFTTGTGALVGVIDTGVDATHPDLASKVKAADDFDSQTRHGPATTDDVGHGTHVASIACAAAGNGIGVAGAGYDCGLIIEKSDLTDASVARSIVSATDQGADAINMSFGTDGRTAPPPAILDAIDYAYDHGVVLVAAASDDDVDEQGDPANVLQPGGTGSDLSAGKGLTVTAATANDRRASYAGFGSEISMAAYGTLDEHIGPGGLLGAFPQQTSEIERGTILPPSPPCACRTRFQGDDRYAYLQGTSMAAPQVAATGALIRHLNPDLPAARILRLLKETARRPAGTGWTPDLGWGILNAGAAVEAARNVDMRAPTSTVRAPASTTGRSIVLRLHGADAAPPGVVASGVAKFRVYRSIDGGRPVRFITTTRTRLRVSARRRAGYAFYVQAVDRAGNVQPFPARPGARTRVLRRR